MFLVSNTRRSRYWMHLCTYWRCKERAIWVSKWESKGDAGDKAERWGGCKLVLVDRRSARYTACLWSPSGLLLIAPWWLYSYISRVGHLLQGVTAPKYRQIPITAPEIPRNSEQIRAHLVTDHWRSSPYDFACHIVLGTVGQRFSVPSSRHILLIRRLRCLLRFLRQIATIRAKQPTSSRKLQTDRSPFLECF